MKKIHIWCIMKNFKYTLVNVWLKDNNQGSHAYDILFYDLVNDVLDDLQKKVYQLRQLGQKDIIIDLGFGFSKTIDQNFELFQQMSDFHLFDLPLLVGVSRKSMIYKSLDIKSEEALNGTTALHMAALMKGAGILRVHDVEEAVETVKLFNLIR